MRHADLPVVREYGPHPAGDGRGLLSQTDTSSSPTYALPDANGAVVARYRYDVFGATRTSSGTADTDYRFTG